MNRQKIREAAFSFVYSLDQGGTMTAADFWANFLATTDSVAQPDTAFFNELVNGVAANSSAIDDIISTLVTDFAIGRIYRIDLVLLRIGVFEIKYTDTAPAIVISSILEIAKKYSTEKSVAFINGVLGKV